MGAREAEVNIFYAERLSKTQDNDALEDLTSRFMVAAAENYEILLETNRQTSC